MSYSVLTALPPQAEWIEESIVITEVDSVNQRIVVEVNGDEISKEISAEGNIITITLPSGELVSAYRVEFTINLDNWSFATPVAQVRTENANAGVFVNPVSSDSCVVHFYSQPEGGRYEVALGFVQDNSQGSTLWIDDPTFIFKPPDTPV
ncbi:MAG TPA: hypothetical protein VJ725_25655 [Thermoanaerobaculia bacterium]|nr:hypothetical protein [Thermoanaerobaculia bacterium]